MMANPAKMRSFAQVLQLGSRLRAGLRCLMRRCADRLSPSLAEAWHETQRHIEQLALEAIKPNNMAIEVRQEPCHDRYATGSWQ